MIKLILNTKDNTNLILASRAADYLVNNPEKQDAILVYGDDVATFYVKRNKASISVWEQ